MRGTIRCRGLRAVALAWVLVLAVAACGDDGDSAAPDDTGGGTTEETAAEAAEETGSSTTEASSAPAEDIDTDAVLRYAIPGVNQSMDPRTANEFQQIMLEQIYDPLLHTTLDGDFDAGLAVEWGLVDDGTAFELTLREGVTFQDGEPFDADAVVANLESARAEGSNLAADLDVVESVEALDPTHVRIELNGPGGHLAAVLAGYAGMMISPAALDTDIRTNPVGAGPFVMTDITESSVTFERWDGYYALDDVTLGGIEMSTFADEAARLRALSSGELDAAFLSASQVAEAESDGLDVLSTTQTTFHGVLLNTSHPALGNDLVRQAIMMAIDRDTIAQALYGGRCAANAQPYPTNYWGYSPDLADTPAGAFDVAAAQALMDEAGFGGGFDVTISTGSITIYQRLAEVLQQQLGAIGINSEINVSTTLSDERRNGDFDMIVGAFQAGRPDPTVFAANYYGVDGALNFGGIDFGIEDLIVDARQSTEVADRSGPIHEIMARAIEKGPSIVPICNPETITASQPGVSGLDMTVLGTRDFRFATIEAG